MNLCLDIGNSRTKAGVFEGNRLHYQTHWLRWTPQEIQALRNRFPIRRVILSSVADPDAALLPVLAEMGWFALELTPDTPLPFRNAYQTPQTLGKDRLAAIAGAHALYPGQNALAIDAGTCIKYDLIDAAGVYHGGNIAPGLHMRLRAMHEQTARLPLVDLKMPELFFGTSTQTALQNGALRGAVLEIQGFIQLFARHRASLQVTLTGGDAEFLIPFLPGPTIEPSLVLIGLNHILNHNS